MEKTVHRATGANAELVQEESSELSLRFEQKLGKGGCSPGADWTGPCHVAETGNGREMRFRLMKPTAYFNQRGAQ